MEFLFAGVDGTLGAALFAGDLPGVTGGIMRFSSARRMNCRGVSGEPPDEEGIDRGLFPLGVDNEKDGR